MSAYDDRNYRSYDCLTDDGLTEWHPAFLELGDTLEECAQKYRGFCRKYKSKKNAPRKRHYQLLCTAGAIALYT